MYRPRDMPYYWSHCFPSIWTNQFAYQGTRTKIINATNCLRVKLQCLHKSCNDISAKHSLTFAFIVSPIQTSHAVYLSDIDLVESVHFSSGIVDRRVLLTSHSINLYHVSHAFTAFYLQFRLNFICDFWIYQSYDSEWSSAKPSYSLLLRRPLRWRKLVIENYRGYSIPKYVW